MSQTVTLQDVYSKLTIIEKRLSRVENKLSIPEIKLTEKEMNELNKIREEIRKGNYLNEKELFSALVKWLHLFEVIASKKILKQIKPINKKLKLKILDLLFKLKSTPVPIEEFNITKITGSEKTYRIKIQQIRIIYDIHWNQKKIEILKIDKRKNRTYKKIWIISYTLIVFNTTQQLSNKPINNKTPLSKKQLKTTIIISETNNQTKPRNTKSIIQIYCFSI